MDEDMTWGGFSVQNVKKWVITECLKSGDPSNFILALSDAVDAIEDEFFNDTEYWEKLYASWDS